MTRASLSAQQSLSQERLQEILHYDPDTGVFTWRVKTAKHVEIGAVAGRISNAGYVRIGVACIRYRAHRLVWLYMTGEWPKEQIDHRNGVRNDNAWANLREASSSENHQNAIRPLGRYGVRGVYKNQGKWEARIYLRGRRIYLGSFATADEAGAAYLAAKAKLHPFQPIPRDAAGIGSTAIW